MAEPRLFVAHAPRDRELVENLFRPIRNLPVAVAPAGEELSSGTVRRDLEGQLGNSDLFVPVLTEAGAADPFVNQEVGYATAREIPTVPVVADGASLDGYLSEADPVAYDPSNLEETAFHLLTELRDELAPLGTLSTPNWFLTFRCSTRDCDERVELAIDAPQAVLWKQYRHDERLETTCPECERRYEFNPATLGYVQSAAPRQ